MSYVEAEKAYHRHPRVEGWAHDENLASEGHSFCWSLVETDDALGRLRQYDASVEVRIGCRRLEHSVHETGASDPATCA